MASIVNGRCPEAHSTFVVRVGCSASVTFCWIVLSEKSLLGANSLGIPARTDRVCFTRTDGQRLLHTHGRTEFAFTRSGPTSLGPTSRPHARSLLPIGSQLAKLPVRVPSHRNQDILPLACRNIINMGRQDSHCPPACTKHETLDDQKWKPEILSAPSPRHHVPSTNTHSGF